MAFDQFARLVQVVVLQRAVGAGSMLRGADKCGESNVSRRCDRLGLDRATRRGTESGTESVVIRAKSCKLWAMFACLTESYRFRNRGVVSDFRIVSANPQLA
jgi:hypothetical protein